LMTHDTRYSGERERDQTMGIKRWKDTPTNFVREKQALRRK
jgi:hypothetical protein